jgi:1-acyl-sn-glycerol-3-phosphate acyltransferase
VVLVNREDREDRVKYQLSRFLIGPALHLLARTEISGTDNVPASGAAILASNHVSILDSFYLPLLLERPVTFAAKSEYFTGKRPTDRVVGAYLRATKQLSVDRAGARAGQEMLQAALGLLNGGALFGIYPEGTRSPDGRLYRGRTGVGWLALHARVPVIPVAMFGTVRMLPPGQRIPRPGRVRVKIGKPLHFDEYFDQPAGARQRRAVTDRVMESIQELSGQEYVPMYASVRKEQLAAERGKPRAGGAGGKAQVDRDPVV